MGRQHRILSAGIFFLLALSAASIGAKAATVGTVTITGKVPQACNILVVAAAGASNIADISAGDTDRTIANVTESCNDISGYTVTVNGSHSGNHTGLFVDSVSGATHPFTINYNGSAVSTGGIVTDVSVAGINLSKAVKITYGANPALTPSTGFTYGETLTFTIAAK